VQCCTRNAVTRLRQVQALSQFGDLPANVDLIVMRQQKMSVAKAAVIAAKATAAGAPVHVPSSAPSSASIPVSAVVASFIPAPARPAVPFAAALLSPAHHPSAPPAASQLPSVSPANALAALQLVTSDASVAAIAYYDEAEFAAQLCGEFAHEEGTNYSVSVPLQEACITLQRILASKPQAVANRVQLASALADAEAIVKLRDSGSGHEQRLQNELYLKERQLRDELSGIQKVCDPNLVLEKLQLDEAQARSAAASDASLLEQQLGTDALQVNEMKEAESLAIAAKDFKKAQELNSRLKAYVTDCAQRVQAVTSQRKLQLEQQLLQLRTAARDTNAAAEQRVAAMESSLEAVLVNHRSQLQQLRKLISSLTALALRTRAFLNRQPAWPLHEALLRFDLPLHLWERHWFVSKKWFPRFFILRGRRLYYSDGKKGLADSHEGALAFARSNPAPDGHYCIDLKGAHARCVTAGFAVHVCDTHAQAAVSRAAVHPSTGRRSRSRSSSLQGMRCISMCALVCTHVTRHLAGCKGRVPCCRR